ncbi:MAG: histidinol-phosphate transaminase [Pseudomonadota bacterium]|nr:histidinol-phosphate transaminase [Pseudomonadota bacterium]
MSINRRELIKISGLSAMGIATGNLDTRLVFAANASEGQLVDLSGNENPYGPSSMVKEVLNNNLYKANRYYYATQKELVKQIAEHENVSSDYIVLGAGSSEVLCASILAYTDSDRHVLTADQSYGAIPQFTSGIGRKTLFVSLDNELRFDLEALQKQITDETGLIYICNPNNPTGTMVNAEKLRDFCTSIPKNLMVLIDEAYLEFTDNFQRDTMTDLVKKGHNVIVTRTFSKIHGLAGMRIGYSVAPPNVSKNITSHKMCKFIGPLAVHAAATSLKQSEFQDFCRAKAKEGRELVFNLCDQLGLDYAYGMGNFVFLDPKMPHDKFRRMMRENGVDTARSFPPRKNWARVTMGTSEEMKVFARILPKVLNT